MTKPVAPEKNQCDGCALGLPVDENGNHLREGAIFGIHQSCTKHKYGDPAPEPSSKPCDCISPAFCMKDQGTLQDGFACMLERSKLAAPALPESELRPIHKTVPLLVWADIDEGIVEMVRYLNTIPGVRTHASCQGTLGEGGPHPYRAQVMTMWDNPAIFERLKAEFDFSETEPGQNIQNGWCYLHPREGWSAPTATAGRELPLELPSDPQRMMDLIRYMRHELSREGLISEQEYTLLVSDSDNGKRVARLESYDEFRLSLARAQEQIARMTEFWDCAMSQSVGLRYNYETKVVTNERAESAEQQIAALSDSARVHSNILTGQIALTKAQAIHIAGLPADIEQQIAALQGRIEEVILLLDNYRDFGNNHAWEHPQILRDKIRNILTAPIAPEKGQD